MKRWSKRIGLAVAGLLVALLVYGILIEPRLILDEVHADVPVPGLGEELGGTEIALLADFQLGMWFANEGMARRAVETAVAEEPDVVLLGGDFVYSTDPGIETQIDTLLDVLDPLVDAGIPTYAVLGNHDHEVDAAEELATALEGVGIPSSATQLFPCPARSTTPPGSCTWSGSAPTGRTWWTSTPPWPTSPTARRGWCSCTTPPSSTSCPLVVLR